MQRRIIVSNHSPYDLVNAAGKLDMDSLWSLDLASARVPALKSTQGSESDAVRGGSVGILPSGLAGIAAVFCVVLRVAAGGRVAIDWGESLLFAVAAVSLADRWLSTHSVRRTHRGSCTQWEGHCDHTGDQEEFQGSGRLIIVAGPSTQPPQWTNPCSALARAGCSKVASVKFMGSLYFSRDTALQYLKIPINYKRVLAYILICIWNDIIAWCSVRWNMEMMKIFNCSLKIVILIFFAMWIIEMMKIFISHFQQSFS